MKRAALAMVSLAACGRIGFDEPCVVQQLSASGSTACVVRSDGALVCWGRNLLGELGDGTTIDRPQPTRVLDDVISVGAGEHGACAIKRDGTAWCWGLNEFGQVGDGTTAQRTLPTQVLSLGSVAEIGTGQYHSCARTADGGMWCWGDNASGELGVDNVLPSALRKHVSPFPHASTGMTIGDLVTCVTIDTGGVACWGAGLYGPFGGADQLQPAIIPELAGGVQVSNGCHAHGCATLADGSVKCWGENTHGEVGDGSTAARLTPVPVAGLAGPVRTMSVGALHTCALLQTGALECWGDNTFGELGIAGGDSLAPVPVPGVPAIDQISAGCGFTCARHGNDIWCWGTNDDGALGDGTTTSRSTPLRTLDVCAI